MLAASPADADRGRQSQSGAEVGMQHGGDIREERGGTVAAFDWTFFFLKEKEKNISQLVITLRSRV